MKDYKHIHRPNPYKLQHETAERILNWGSLIIGIALFVLLITGVIG